MAIQVLLEKVSLVIKLSTLSETLWWEAQNLSSCEIRRDHARLLCSKNTLRTSWDIAIPSFTVKVGVKARSQ